MDGEQLAPRKVTGNSRDNHVDHADQSGRGRVQGGNKWGAIGWEWTLPEEGDGRPSFPTINSA